MSSFPVTFTTETVLGSWGCRLPRWWWYSPWAPWLCYIWWVLRGTRSGRHRQSAPVLSIQTAHLILRAVAEEFLRRERTITRRITKVLPVMSNNNIHIERQLEIFIHSPSRAQVVQFVYYRDEDKDKPIVDLGMGYTYALAIAMSDVDPSRVDPSCYVSEGYYLDNDNCPGNCYRYCDGDCSTHVPFIFDYLGFLLDQGVIEEWEILAANDDARPTEAEPHTQWDDEDAGENNSHYTVEVDPWALLNLQASSTSGGSSAGGSGTGQ